jgi:sulfite oxidase
LRLFEEHGISMFPITQPIPIQLESEEDYKLQIAARGGRDPVE